MEFLLVSAANFLDFILTLLGFEEDLVPLRMVAACRPGLLLLLTLLLVLKVLLIAGKASISLRP